MIVDGKRLLGAGIVDWNAQDGRQRNEIADKIKAERAVEERLVVAQRRGITVGQALHRAVDARG